MGNINANFQEIIIENLTTLKKNNLQMYIDNSNLDKESVKKAKTKMTYISKHNKELKDSDLIESVLLGHYYLNSLSKQARAEIVQQMSQYCIKENNDVFVQGDHPTYFYILREGKCDMYIDGEKIKTLKRGECFGEKSMLWISPSRTFHSGWFALRVWQAEGSISLRST